MTERRTSVQAFVEVPRGSRNKYEIDPTSGRIRLDRVLYSPLHHPADYGLIGGTLAEDGDHLDVLIFTYEPTFPGCLVEVRPIGVLDMRDEKGVDQKVLAVPVGDPRFDGVTELDLRLGGSRGGLAARRRGQAAVRRRYARIAPRSCRIGGGCGGRQEPDRLDSRSRSRVADQRTSP